VRVVVKIYNNLRRVVDAEGHRTGCAGHVELGEGPAIVVPGGSPVEALEDVGDGAVICRLLNAG
jgi:hypothetical protein